MRAFRDGMRFRKSVCRWSLDERRDWILERLRFCVRRAYNETVYYRDLLDQIGFDPAGSFSFEDFSRIPVLTREDIHRAGTALVSRTIPAHLLQRDSTGGSTGVPTEIWVGPEEKGWRESAIENCMRRIGAPSGTRTALLWGHHLDPVKSDRMHDRWYSFATNVRWFDCFRLSPEVLERYHNELTSWMPACMIAYAGAAGALAEYILERGYHARYPTHSLITGAEKLLAHHRQAIEAAFDAPVHERYGGRDVGSVGFQMQPRSSLAYEIEWANLLVEPETTEPLSSVLITKLHGDGMPMLRYRVGDLACFPDGSTPGHPVFKLDEITGREADRIWLPDGRWVHGLEMPHMLKDYGVKEFVLVQRRDYSVELRIIPQNNWQEDNRSWILATLASNLPGVSLNVELVEEIPRTRSNKHRPVISEVEPSLRRLAS
jgi:phenylacetate-coenzyme A ligase PaaK-like adenylate-forming protein